MRKLCAILALICFAGAFYAYHDNYTIRASTETSSVQEELKAEQAVLDLLGKEWALLPVGDVKFLTQYGKLMSKGYSTFFVQNGKVWGKLGAYEEPVELRVYYIPQVVQPFVN